MSEVTSMWVDWGTIRADIVQTMNIISIVICWGGIAFLIGYVYYLWRKLQ
jgi:arginine exporter protein ArgO